MFKGGGVDTNIVAIIQARTGSTRLPGKVLLDLEGQPVLSHVITRVKASKLVTDVVVATTIKKDDLAIVRLCSNANTRVFAGLKMMSWTDIIRPRNYWERIISSGSQRIVLL